MINFYPKMKFSRIILLCVILVLTIILTCEGKKKSKKYTSLLTQGSLKEKHRNTRSSHHDSHAKKHEGYEHMKANDDDDDDDDDDNDDQNASGDEASGGNDKDSNVEKKTVCKRKCKTPLTYHECSQPRCDQKHEMVRDLCYYLCKHQQVHCSDVCTQQ